MGFPQLIKRIRSEAERLRLTQVVSNQSGVALFMVMAALTILVIIVTEVSYVAAVNRKMADNAQDQLKAHYLAKSALKLSLLRLSAYQQIKGYLGQAGNAVPVPKGLVEKVWNFPLMFPIPVEIPGLTLQAKDQITKFQNESGLQGTFTAVIQSRSTGWNINSVIETFAKSAAQTKPSPSPSPTPPPAGGQSNPQATPTPNPGATQFDPEAARKALRDFLAQILQNKFVADPDFAEEYRDFNIDEFVDYLYAWVDRKYEGRFGGRETIPPKQAPMFSLSELHMVYGVDDKIYDLFAPVLTTSLGQGININTMDAVVLQALIPVINEEEIKDFFEFRDSMEMDNLFKTPEDFFKYLLQNVSIFRGDAQEIERFKKQLAERRIELITDETQFKITVQAQVNQATQVLEAEVSLVPPRNTGTGGPGGTVPGNPNPTPPGQTPGDTPPGGNPLTPQSSSGLKVTSMRFL